jgi:ABC-type sugar transport system substrate-binding protein
MPPTRRVALFLTHEDATQLAWASTVQEAGKKHGFDVALRWSDTSAEQNHAIGDCIFQDTADVLLIMPAAISGPAALLSQAARRGKAIILLDRVANDMDPARSWSLVQISREHPGQLAVRIAPDEVEIGRIQGRQVLALLPTGGSGLLVQGDPSTPGAIGRTTGIDEILASRTTYELAKVNGAWSSARAETAVQDWLKLMLINPAFRLQCVVAQSEVMLDGIRRALERARPELAQLPLTGCDGLPAFKRDVDEGRLAATVEIPSRTEAAVRVLVDYFTRGALPPTQEIALAPSSYPSLARLAARPSA